MSPHNFHSTYDVLVYDVCPECTTNEFLEDPAGGVPCPVCHGIGIIVTEEGRKILEALKEKESGE